jgi:carboxypeptidase T
VNTTPSTLSPVYSLRLGGKTMTLPERSQATAGELDANKDRFLDDDELRGHVLGEESVSLSRDDSSDLLQEFKADFAGVPNPFAAGYHSFAQVEAEIAQVAEQHPDIVQKVSLGKTAEGRDIWALKISQDAQKDTSDKSGLVITGCHHAREWMTVEAPLKLIHDLTDHPADPAVQRRLKDAEIWVVPVANPDGYEFSRNESNYWRKNRRPLGVDQNGQPTEAVGVDLNRNYWDGKAEHLYVYRPDGDTPGNSDDDYSATSDNPYDETYRGPEGGSEAEVKALLNLELSHPNVKAVLDYHSYGDTILYPFGYTREPSPHLKLYQEIGKKMQAASSGFKLEQSVGLYPASGTSDDTQDLNGILNFTIEMGRSFQPNPKSIPATTDRVARATHALIDEIITRDLAGTLPQHSMA